MAVAMLMAVVGGSAQAQRRGGTRCRAVCSWGNLWPAAHAATGISHSLCFHFPDWSCQSCISPAHTRTPTREMRREGAVGNGGGDGDISGCCLGPGSCLVAQGSAGMLPCPGGAAAAPSASRLSTAPGPRSLHSCSLFPLTFFE